MKIKKIISCKLNEIISIREHEIKEDANSRYTNEYSKIFEKYHLDSGIWDDFVKLKKDFEAELLG